MSNSTPEFIKKDEWPPQSPDVNSMDYSIWELLKDKVYRGRNDKFSVTELKQKIIDGWRKISTEEIRKSIGAWKKILQLIIEEDGAVLEMNFLNF